MVAAERCLELAKSAARHARTPLERLRKVTRDLVARIRRAGRPFILGSESDVLHVPGRGAGIRRGIAGMPSEGA